MPNPIVFLLAMVLWSGVSCQEPSPVPVVLWHGMGDSCCNPLSMGFVKSLLEQHIPGVYVHSLMIGGNVVSDTENGFFMPINEQVDMACHKIGQDSKLGKGYNAIGFSQGGQFLRAVAQRCPQGMRNLITFGGQHQGVYGFPQCMGEDHRICDYVRRLLNYGAYESWIQDFLVQAQYWHDPLDEDTYREKSQFLADINNELHVKNRTYKTNLLQLDHFVMIKFNLDTMVDPRDSEWFEFYRPGQAEDILPLNESRIYKEDWLGLKKLDESGKLVRLEVEGNHLQFTQEFLVDKIIRPYLL